MTTTRKTANQEANKTLNLEEDEARFNKLGIRLPQFWTDEPELWFAQVESTLALCGVKDDEAKYAYVLARIEPSQAKEIKDVITNPPANNKYEAVKKALIQRLTDSQEHRIRQLLEHEELGDRKPSQFLRHLTTLAGKTISSDLLRTLWIGRLPAQMQAILATRTGDRLEEVAEQADRIHEIGNRTAVLATAVQPTMAMQSAGQSPMETHMELLTKQVAALTLQVATMATQMERGRPRNRPRSYSRPRPRSRTPYNNDICFYHRRFGEEARKCTQPCKFKAKNEEGSR